MTDDQRPPRLRDSTRMKPTKGSKANSVPAVWISWPAQRDIRERLETGTGREIGGVCFGRVIGNLIQIEEILPNPSGPDEPSATRIDYAAYARYERSAGPGDPPEDEWRIVASIHSHEPLSGPGPATASDTDLRSVREVAQLLEHPFASLIITARGERWEGGYPAGLDWSDPFLTAIVARDDEVWLATHQLEPEWLHRLRNTVRFRTPADQGAH